MGARLAIATEPNGETFVVVDGARVARVTMPTGDLAAFAFNAVDKAGAHALLRTLAEQLDSDYRVVFPPDHTSLGTWYWQAQPRDERSWAVDVCGLDAVVRRRDDALELNAPDVLGAYQSVLSFLAGIEMALWGREVMDSSLGSLVALEAARWWPRTHFRDVTSDYGPTVFCGDSVAFAKSDESMHRLVAWRADEQFEVVFSHDGHMLAQWGSGGECAAVLFDRFDPESPESSRGRIVRVDMQSGQVTPLREFSGDPALGGPGYGLQQSFARFDHLGRLALHVAGRTDVFDVDHNRIASRDADAAPSWNGSSLVYEHPDGGYCLWDPWANQERELRRLSPYVVGPNGTVLHKLRPLTSNLFYAPKWFKKLEWTRPGARRTSVDLPHRFNRARWLGATGVVCEAMANCVTDPVGPPVHVDTLTGQVQYVFDDPYVGIAACSATDACLLALPAQGGLLRAMLGSFAGARC